MFKRIFLFLAMNLAIIVLVTIVLAILESVFGFSITAYGANYTGLFIFALIFGFTGSFISLFMSKWMAKKAYNVQIIGRDKLNNLNDKEKLVWQVVEELSERNRIKMPEVGIYMSKDPNAFATGPSKNNSLVAVSSGLLDMMDKNAIEGVVAHEMAHVLNGDMVTMTLLQGVLNTFVIFFARVIAEVVRSRNENLGGFAYYGIVIALEIVFGIFASLIAMAFSRYREFRADAGSAKFVGKEKMIAGLQALKNMQALASSDDSKLAAMMISTKKRKGFFALFSSHPDLDDRIQALENLRV
ncbi:MAG: protease HtpX [Candidatus Gracilibacteria bacterium]|nr:protease HtpX [Candidatus Gracilibacteria bacterium]